MRFLKLENGLVVKTDKKIYDEYWRLMNHQNYLKRVDFDFVDSFSGDDTIQKLRSDVNVEQLAETAMLIMLLRKSLQELSEEEREIIDELFLNDDNASYRSVAERHGVTHQALHKRVKKILLKLKKMIERDS